MLNESDWSFIEAVCVWRNAPNAHDLRISVERRSTTARRPLNKHRLRVPSEVLSEMRTAPPDPALPRTSARPFHFLQEVHSVSHHRLSCGNRHVAPHMTQMSQLLVHQLARQPCWRTASSAHAKPSPRTECIGSSLSACASSLLHGLRNRPMPNRGRTLISSTSNGFPRC